MILEVYEINMILKRNMLLFNHIYEKITQIYGTTNTNKINYFTKSKIGIKNMIIFAKENNFEYIHIYRPGKNIPSLKIII